MSTIEIVKIIIKCILALTPIWAMLSFAFYVIYEGTDKQKTAKESMVHGGKGLLLLVFCSFIAIVVVK